jgi:hypothetical protein
MKTKDFEGVRFYIDRPKGFVKTWDLPDGSKKTYTYPVDYGYFPKILGEDGEGLDAFVGDDPNGHYESFEKLKPSESGNGLVLDETKFLVGVTDAERDKIYGLYNGGEVSCRVTYPSLSMLLLKAESFKGKKHSKIATVQNPAKQVTLSGAIDPKDKELMARDDFATEAGKIAMCLKFGIDVSDLNQYPINKPVAEFITRQKLLEDGFRGIDREKNVVPLGDESSLSVTPVTEKTSAKGELLNPVADPGVTDYGFMQKIKLIPADQRSTIRQTFDGIDTFDKTSPMTDPGTINQAPG